MCLIHRVGPTGRLGNSLSTYLIMCLAHNIIHLDVKYRCLRQHLNKTLNLTLITAITLFFALQVTWLQNCEDFVANYRHCEYLCIVVCV